MKASTTVAVAAGAAIAYLFGTEKGRARRAQLTRQANQALHDRRVQQGLATVADQAEKNADRLPGLLTPVARAASSVLRSALDKPVTPPPSTPA